ncbi:MAG: hypothetical protein ACJ798_11460 [Phenylobacterium sp.]
MNTTSHDNAAYADAATPPGERIHGPPSAGLIFVMICWLLAAGVLFVEGALIFAGILEAVA